MGIYMAQGMPGVWMEEGWLYMFVLNRSKTIMATTGELRAIIQELHLVDVGDAASYLGEEAIVVVESPALVQPAFVLVTESEFVPEFVHLTTCDCTTCDLVHA